MIASLVAVLLVSTQPAPEDVPVEAPVTEAEVEVQGEEAEAQAEAAEAQAEAAAAEAEAAAARAEAAAAEAEAAAEAAAAEVQTAAAEPEEEVVCRRRLRSAERIGQRHRVVTDCRPRSEWQHSRRRGGSGN